MSARPDDLIREACERMRTAASRIEEVVASLRRARLVLQAHPDFAVTVRAEAAAKGKGLREELKAIESTTYANWLDHCIKSTLEDLSLDDTVAALRSDLHKGRKGMEDFIESERRDLVRFAKRRQRRQYQAAA